MNRKRLCTLPLFSALFASSALKTALLAVVTVVCSAQAGQTEPPPDPGFEASVIAADAIVDCEILAGGPFRAIAQTRKTLRGSVPKVFELEGFNSYNWDTVHHGFATGSRWILFLSKTEKPDVFSTLTPAAPRLSVQLEGVLLALGDPPFRIPVKAPALEEGIALISEKTASGKTPERAAAWLRGLWDEGDIESRYLAVAMAGALRESRVTQMLIDASRDKLLKLRQTAVEALGKCGTPEALKALRALLKDDKASIARESAQMLVRAENLDALPELLEWVRRNAANDKAAAAKAGDPARTRTIAVAASILALAKRRGALGDVEQYARPLLEIARGTNDLLARAALETYGELAGAAQVPALIELADDNTFDLRDRAQIAVEELALKSFKSSKDARAWWAQSGAGFGEDLRRDIAEAAARGLATTEDPEERRKLVETLRAAPGGIALVCAGPLLLKSAGSSLFAIDDLASWESTLALPYIVERLGRDNSYERHDAFDTLIKMCDGNPRLNAAFWPLLRAGLCDRDSTTRYSAQRAAGQLSQPDAMPALLDTLNSRGFSEGQTAIKAIYALSYRTLGLSGNEPPADQALARGHLRGWWKEFSKSGAKVPAAMADPDVSPALWPDMEPAARAQKLEAAVLHADSRVAQAALNVLLAERPAGDLLWQKLIPQGRQRDKAHGLLGLIGGDASHVDALFRRLSTDEPAEPALLRAIALLDLATLKANGKPAGAARIVEWVKKPENKIEIPWKRLAILSLGLADGDAASLAYLGEALKIGLEAKAPDPDAYSSDPVSDEYSHLRPALVALCARTDSNELLQRVLEDSSELRMREIAARALSLRRVRAAVPALVKALAKADRYSWPEFARAFDPLFENENVPLIRELLDSASTPPRTAAAWLLAQHPNFGDDAETRGALVTGLNDSYSLVRYYCAESLGKRKAKSALKKLVDLLTDTDDDVRAGAAEAIGNIGDKAACKEADMAAGMELKLDARWFKALAIAGNPLNSQVLMKFANSSLYLEQRAGLEAISASNDPDAQERLLKAFRNDDAALQTVAADLLAKRGDAAIEAVKEDLAKPDKNARARAIQLLGRIDSAASREALKNIKDADPALQALAEFLAQRGREAK